MKRRIVLLTIFGIVIAGCITPSDPGTPFDQTQGKPDPAILATTTFLADIARNIAGDRLLVGSLLPVNADPHSYQPTPQDAARIADSRLLIVNGMEYEHFIETLLDVQRAGNGHVVVTASEGIETLHAEEHAGEEEAGSDHAHEAGDPHMWLDPNLVIRYVENIRDGLILFDPEGEAAYRSNAEAYIVELKELDTWIVEQVSSIPPERRLLVTNHESLGYFAERYGFIIVGTLIESVSSGASPSAGQLADLIGRIQTSGAPAIFLASSDNASLAQQIADETGVQVITDLYLESLTDGPPAATYIDMLKYNVMRIVEALQ